MKVNREQITTEHGVLSYLKFGQGEQIFLLFHGFGQHAQHFFPLESIADTHTLYTFDLFFHGESQWNHPEQPIRKASLIQFIQKFLEKESIEYFSLGGFSLGGRIVLTLLEDPAMAHRVNYTMLIAPDGIGVNIWYRLATSYEPFKTIFKSVVEQPQLFIHGAGALAKVKIMEKSLIRFVKHQMDSPEKRQHVHQVWTSYRLLKFRLLELIRQINYHNIPVVFYLELTSHHTKNSHRTLQQSIEALKNSYPILRSFRPDQKGGATPE